MAFPIDGRLLVANALLSQEAKATARLHPTYSFLSKEHSILRKFSTVINHHNLFGTERNIPCNNMSTNPIMAGHTNTTTSATTGHSHLVFTATEEDGTSKLYIYVSGDILSFYVCDTYVPDAQGHVKERQRQYSPPYVVQDLGRFSDPAAFERIAKNQSVPAIGAHQSKQDHLNAWVSALVQHLEQHHADSWTPRK
jgi:hypothetical protein